MKLLAFDSTTEACSAALHVDGAVQECFELAPRCHTHLLLPMAQQLLSAAGIGMRDLDYLAFAQGPGSFTGLRITLGLVQGLAFGLDRPVIGVSSLAALAARALRLRGAGRAAVAMDARMNQVYWGEYALDGTGYCGALKPDCLLDPAHVPRLETGSWCVAGTGWQRHAGLLSTRSGLRPDSDDLELYPHAEEVARLAVQEAERGNITSALTMQPVYLRLKVAEKMQKA